MAAYNQRTVTVTRHEYVLDSPAHADEVGKAWNTASQDIRAIEGPSPMIWIESRDDEVVVVWEERRQS